MRGSEYADPSLFRSLAIIDPFERGGWAPKEKRTEGYTVGLKLRLGSFFFFFSFLPSFFLLAGRLLIGCRNVRIITSENRAHLSLSHGHLLLLSLIFQRQAGALAPLSLSVSVFRLFSIGWTGRVGGRVNIHDGARSSREGRSSSRSR